MTDDLSRIDLRELIRPSAWGSMPLASLGAAMAEELLASRALLADLKAEGCPMEAGLDGGSAGILYCCYCHVEIVDAYGKEPKGEHVAMEDGKPCLWTRIEQA